MQSAYTTRTAMFEGGGWNAGPQVRAARADASVSLVRCRVRCLCRDKSNVYTVRNSSVAACSFKKISSLKLVKMFDTDKFIEAVHGQPSLWDKAIDDYSNRGRRDRSWELVGREMFPDWYGVDEKERLIRGKVCRDRMFHK